MRHLTYLLLFLMPLAVFGNAAQPGIWGAGGMGNYTLLFPEDSTGYKKVQMVKEAITIQLYPGYAAVYGRYWMHNTSTEKVDIMVGYPINSYFNSSKNGDLLNIQFDSIYALQTSQNGQPVMLEPISKDMQQNQSGADNWMVWRNTFYPGDTSLIEVYFLVNTNDASISEGYNKDHYNGFTYLLETGAVWKQPIVEGEIIMELMPPLTFDDIEGLYPATGFQRVAGKNVLYYKFNNLSPTPESNIVMTYGKCKKPFNFTDIINNRGPIFNKLPPLAISVWPTTPLEAITFTDPYEVDSKQAQTGIGLLILGGIVGLIIVIGLPLLLVKKLVGRKK